MIILSSQIYVRDTMHYKLSNVLVPGVFYIHGVYIKTLLSRLIRLIDTPGTRTLLNLHK